MEIKFIFGRICSGKDFICKEMNKNDDYHIITISNILRKITGLTKRSDLLMTEDLKEDIFKEIKKEFEGEDKIIVNGIRQIEVLEYILKDYGDNDIQMYWVDCKDEIRKNRFENRQSNKDNLSIEEADERDNKMGLGEIIEKYGNEMIRIDNNV
jgi:hypothetical protein